MQRGDVFSHKDFTFKNGERGPKLLVLLYIPPKNMESYLFCKTTAQKKEKSITPGCQFEVSLFFIRGNTNVFREDTWLQLWDIYPINAESVLQDCMKQYMKRIGTLNELSVRQILNCIKKSLDVEERYAELILKNQFISL